MFKFELCKVADTLLFQAKLFNCDLETAWNEYIHDIIKEQYTYEVVIGYLERTDNEEFRLLKQNIK